MRIARTRLGLMLTMAAVAMLPIAPARAGSSANLLTNGSFETIASGTHVAGAGNSVNVGVLPGWTLSTNTAGYSYGSGPGDGQELIVTNGSTQDPHGDKVAADPFTYGPDGAGSHALYFVDDNAHETISQSIMMSAGLTYEVGFDLYQTKSGAGNPGDFTLTASLGASIITQATPQALTAGIWYHFAETYVPPATGLASFVFSYSSANAISKDVVVDQVYVETPPTTPGLVAEPPGLAVLIGGIALLALVHRRNSQNGVRRPWLRWH